MALAQLLMPPIAPTDYRVLEDVPWPQSGGSGMGGYHPLSNHHSTTIQDVVIQPAAPSVNF